MATARTELIVHPVSLRIIETIAGRELTSQQLARLLPEVPVATLYRRIKKLHEGGILRVVEERSVNGIVEKLYAMEPGAAHIDREEFAKITPEEHARYFSIFLGTLSQRMKRYLETPDHDVVREAMTYFQATLFLTDEEARQLRVELLELMKRYYQPGPVDETRGRRRRTVGVALIPGELQVEGQQAPEGTDGTEGKGL